MGAGARRFECPVVAVNESRDVPGDNGSPERVGSNALWRLLTDRGWARGVRDRELFVFHRCGADILVCASCQRDTSQTRMSGHMATRVYLIRHGATELSAE